MQSAIISHGRVGRENSRLYGWTIAVEAPTIKRNAADIFQIEINCVGCNRVQEAIKRLLQGEFEFSEKAYDFVKSRPVQQTAWPMDQQTHVFVKLDIRRQRHLHCLRLPSWCNPPRPCCLLPITRTNSSRFELICCLV